jgi:putative effector of murein hydrolase
MWKTFCKILIFIGLLLFLIQLNIQAYKSNLPILLIIVITFTLLILILFPYQKYFDNKKN